MKKHDELPTMEELEQKRKNDKVMRLFTEKILPCIAGRNHWVDKRAKMPLSDAVSVTDEAFAYLVLENIWDTWSKLSDQVLGEVLAGEVSGRNARKKTGDNGGEGDNVDENKRKEAQLTGREGKYTCPVMNRDVSARKYKGWSKAGLNRYNTLIKEVKKDRESKEGKEFEARLLKDWMESKKGKREIPKADKSTQDNVALDEQASFMDVW